MKNISKIMAFILSLILLTGTLAGCKKDYKENITVGSLGEQNLLRQVQMLDSILFDYIRKSSYEDEEDSSIYMFNKVRLSAKTGTGGVSDVWPYTAAVEAVIKTMHNLKIVRDGNVLYSQLYKYYDGILEQMIMELDWYKGTAPIPSYNGTNEWSIYAVNRGPDRNRANIEGIAAVYDDQMWLIREMLEAYNLTGKAMYLEKAEYLTAYVLDGWDQSYILDANGNSTGKQYGGFPWGHDYSTKHSCSNGPMIAPLVWLYEIYKNKPDTTKFDYLTAPGQVEKRTVKKADLYLEFAEKTYSFMVTNLMRADGVFGDMLGGDSKYLSYTEGGEMFKQTTAQTGISGRAYAYNTGAPLSGAVDLYRATGKSEYLNDIKALSDSAFNCFADDKIKEGYYAFPTMSDFDPWFNTVLYRAWVEAYVYYPEVSVYLDAVQKYMDYGYDNFYRDGYLPRNILLGWTPGLLHDEDKQCLEAFSYVSNFGILADYELRYKK